MHLVKETHLINSESKKQHKTGLIEGILKDRSWQESKVVQCVKRPTFQQ